LRLRFIFKVAAKIGFSQRIFNEFFAWGRGIIGWFVGDKMGWRGIIGGFVGTTRAAGQAHARGGREWMVR